MFNLVIFWIFLREFLLCNSVYIVFWRKNDVVRVCCILVNGKDMLFYKVIFEDSFYRVCIIYIGLIMLYF